MKTGNRKNKGSLIFGFLIREPRSHELGRRVLNFS
jgi:hypothetical protein